VRHGARTLAASLAGAEEPYGFNGLVLSPKEWKRLAWIMILKTQASPHSTSGSDALLFREGMSRVAGAVHVVTTDGAAGRGGFTATAVTPVTDSPASLLVCVNTGSRSAQALLSNRVFCVNTLAAFDVEMADIFAGRAGLQGPERFSRGEWDVLETGSPALTTSLVSFDCRISDARVVATHHVIIGDILSIRLGEQRPPLIYQARHYHEL
jgi:flavin reductase